MIETNVRPALSWTLPPELADVLRPGLARLADEIVEKIRHGVPEFDRPLRGASGAEIRAGIQRSLSRFVDRIADAAPYLPHDPRLPRALGRGEFHEGRNVEALQSAYRIGARAAWRRFATIGLGAGHSPETLCALAEALFAHIEEVADQSVQAYSELSAMATRTLQRRRRRLLELLTGDARPASPDIIAQLAAESEWRLPARVACVALAGSWQDRHLMSPAVSANALMDLERPNPFLLIPDADGPGRQEVLVRALGDSVFAIGPTVELADAALSLRLARQTLTLCHRGIITSDPPVRSADHLPTLLMLADHGIVKLMTGGEYGRLAQMAPAKRVRLAETLLALLAEGGTAPEIAARLHVHPQTVRYRMNQLQELYGDRLHDPDWRFHMQIVLRMQALLGRESSALAPRPSQAPPPAAEGSPVLHG